MYYYNWDIHNIAIVILDQIQQQSRNYMIKFIYKSFYA